MDSGDGSVEIDILERGLLPESSMVNEYHQIEEQAQEQAQNDDDDETVLYKASFEEMESNYVKYQTAQWVLYSLLLVLAWGIGLFMFIYIPIRRFILRKEFQSRKLYITPNAIIYKVTRPVPFPCFGVLKKEKHILLPSVADIVIEQGYLQSYFGIYSIRIENYGVRRPSSDDVKIQGVTNPREFRKVVLTHLANIRNQNVSRRASRNENLPNLISGELILKKLEEVGSSVKRVQGLMEEQNYPKSQLID